MPGPNLATPMMDQYLRIKASLRDTLLFFRLGDFYEMFYEDAKIGSRVLEIALTSRQKVPMCGVPYHAVNAYLPKLLKRGYKVAICEQVEDPRSAKGVVKREIIKILTPGTAVEVDFEAAKENLFVAALAPSPEGWALALTDLSTGEMRALESDGDDRRALADELLRAAPREVVFPEDAAGEVNGFLDKLELRSAARSPVESWAFDPPRAKSVLLAHFGAASLAGFGFEDRPRAAAAAGALLHYIKTARRDTAALVNRLSYLNAADHMVLDASTVRNLELVRNLRDGRIESSLLDVIDFTVTPMGGRLLRSWLLRPLLDAGAIRRRQDAVADWLGDLIVRRELRESLKGVLDLERLAGRISLAAAHPRDLVALKKSLLPLPKIGSFLAGRTAAALAETRRDWDEGADIAALIDKAILDEPAFLLTEGGIVKDGFNAELDDLRSISRSGKSYISDLERRERERTGIGSLKVRFNKVFGYYIEVTKSNLGQVPADYERKQTLVGSERFLTPELKEYEEKVLHAEERIGELEHRIFDEVRAGVARETARLQRIAGRVAELDALSALAELASRRNFVRPAVDDGEAIRIKDGRHAVVEAVSGEPFIPNDTFLDRASEQVQIITGPNMGGKSTYLRQVALIVILAQMGSYVPAGEAEVGIVDRVFTRIGATDFLSVGQSTFMVEMLETANILNNATPRSLRLLDEIGRRTSTFDGLSLAWAVAEHLHETESVRAKTLFATHYHELTDLAQTFPRIRNHHVAVREWKEDIVFLRKIVPGPSDRSYGIHVAKLAGIPAGIVTRAREVLHNLEKLELDESGQPRIGYRTSRMRDRRQMMLFSQDRDAALGREIREELAEWDRAEMTPDEAIRRVKSLLKRLGQ